MCCVIQLFGNAYGLKGVRITLGAYYCLCMYRSHSLWRSYTRRPVDEARLVFRLQACIATVVLKLHAWRSIKQLAAEGCSCTHIQRQFVLPIQPTTSCAAQLRACNSAQSITQSVQTCVLNSAQYKLPDKQVKS